MSRAAPLDRNQIVARLGTPGFSEGSLNEPREQIENGRLYNEKWIYTGLENDPSGAPERVIYWHRYDLVATMVRNDGDTQWRPDASLFEELKGTSDRLATHDESRNSPRRARSRYRPVSEFKGKPDLGGRMQEE